MALRMLIYILEVKERDVELACKIMLILVHFFPARISFYRARRPPLQTENLTSSRGIYYCSMGEFLEISPENG